MARKIRPGAEGDALGQQAADLRRGAPGGKRFVGDRATQSREAKRQELARVVEMAKEDAQERHREAVQNTSVGWIVLELALESFRLARSFVLAPFRILEAVRRGRAEGRA